VTRSPSTRPSLAKPGGGSPEFGPAAPAGHPRGDIAKKSIFPGVFLQKGISNSVAVFLILVNCIENHRETRKMQNQFFWINGELSYNFCYSCLG
jgi:hypothetical protein